MKTQNAVIIGYGAIGPVHAAAVSVCDFAELYGICDIDAARLEKAEKEHGCKLFSDFDEVLRDENADCVHICTPHFLHADMIEAALAAGKRVVVEKPAAMTAAEIERLRVSCRGRENEICAVLQNRFNRCVLKMKEIIASGKYGKVIGASGFLTWKRDRRYYESGAWRGRLSTEGGGVVINQAVHVLDLLEYLCGHCEEIEASMCNRTLRGCIETEDTAEAMLKCSSGARIIFYATNGYAASPPFDIEVQLEGASLKYVGKRLFLSEKECFELIETDKGTLIGKANWGGSHERLISNFYSSLCGEKKPYTDICDGLSAARLVTGLYSAAQSGGAVSL